MPLQDHFTRQIDAIRDFMAEPGTNLARLCFDADAETVVRRILLGLHDEDNPHSMIFCDAPFAGEEAFCAQSLEQIVENNEAARADMAEHGVELPPAPRHNNGAAYARYLCEVRESLPEGVGGYVIVVAPDAVSDDKAFATCMASLAKAITTEGAKLLVFDPNEQARLEGIEQAAKNTRLLRIDFRSEGVEEQLRKDLAGEKLSPEERGKYLGMVGAYDAARQQWEPALLAQQQSIQLLAEHGEPADHANALYALGTTHIRAQQAAEAEAALTQAVQLCLDNGLNSLLSMVLTNLGVALQRLQRIEESMQSFDAAVATFDGLGHLPGMSFALDAKAATLEIEKRHEEAEAAWLAALAVYDEVKSDQFADLRQSARKDLREKLGAFYRATEQHSKAAELSV